MSRLLIVPAAGRGARLGSPLPKLLVPVNGRPMIDYIFDRYRDVVSGFLLVVSPTARDQVRQHCEERKAAVELLVQESATGMLDAILVPRTRIGATSPDEVWVTWCDQVAVEAATVARLAEAMRPAPRPALVLPTVESDLPYIHFGRDQRGTIIEVRQRREGDAMPPRGEGDIGLFAMSGAAYLNHLPVYATQASLGRETGERNFLPFIPWLAGRERVETVRASSAMEAVGINTPEELAQVARHLAKG